MSATLHDPLYALAWLTLGAVLIDSLVLSTILEKPQLLPFDCFVTVVIRPLYQNMTQRVKRKLHEHTATDKRDTCAHAQRLTRIGSAINTNTVARIEMKRPVHPAKGEKTSADVATLTATRKESPSRAQL